MFTTETTESENLLSLIAENRASFPDLFAYINSNSIRPSSVFLPQTVQKLDSDLVYKDSIIFEAIDFLDTLCFYSHQLHGNPTALYDAFKQAAMCSRTVANTSLMVSASSIDDFIFTSKEDLAVFIDSNPWIISIYVASIVNLLMF